MMARGCLAMVPGLLLSRGDGLHDFLYADHERVASFLAQINGIGALVGNEETASKTRSTGKEGGLNFGAASAKAKGTTDWSKDIRLAYDPLWMNSSKLVDIVSARRTIAPKATYDYGQLLTISGKLMCMDQALFGNLLKSPSIVDQIANGIDAEDVHRSSKAKVKKRKDIAEIVREFINSLPLGVVFILFDAKNAFWFNVKREYLQLQSLDIPLKFPIQIGGEWHVTGVIDALPQDHAEIESVIDNFRDRLVIPQAFTIITQIVVPIVGLFGRAADAYGLNPVTIHREVVL